MDPQALIDPAGAAAPPAPLWFVQLFKVLGFTLHAVPMNLWYAGLVLAVLFRLRSHEHGRRFADRLMAQMPVIIALGVNFGIVPLLFTQLAYHKFFYPATILMAWFWLAIIGLLTAAYYGVYVYASGLGKGGQGSGVRGQGSGVRDSTPVDQSSIINHQSSIMRPRPLVPGPRPLTVAGWIAAVFFIVIGFLFANGLSLMDHVDRWGELWLSHSTGGAALGTALNVSDGTLWPRWLLMFGLALTTTAVWMLVDQAWFAGRESPDYKRWVSGAAPKLYTLGMVWFAVAGSWYVFGTWSPELRGSMFGGWKLALAMATAIAPGLPWVLMMVAWRATASGSQHAPGRVTVSLLALAQFGVLAVNAVSRQVVQNLNLAEFFQWSDQPVREWSPLVVFLVLFVAGLGVVMWIVAQVAKAPANLVDGG